MTTPKDIWAVVNDFGVVLLIADKRERAESVLEVLGAPHKIVKYVPERECHWKHVASKYNSILETECGHFHVLTGGLEHEENKEFIGCPYCLGRITTSGTITEGGE